MEILGKETYFDDKLSQLDSYLHRKLQWECVQQRPRVMGFENELNSSTAVGMLPNIYHAYISNNYPLGHYSDLLVDHMSLIQFVCLKHNQTFVLISRVHHLNKHLTNLISVNIL